MLGMFRKMTKVVIWLVIIAFVGTIILVWGMDLTGSSARKKAARNIAGTVSGVDLPYRQYSFYLDNLYQEEQAKTPDGELDLATVKKLRRQAWDNLVADYLIGREMDSRNITVTDDEFYLFLKNQPLDELQQNPNFQTDGRFDYNKYLAALSNPQAQQFWTQIDAAYRPQLRRQKLFIEISSTVRVSEDEIKDLFINSNEKAKADIIYVPVAKFTQPGPEVTEAEVKEYYEIHKEEYKTGKRSALNYVSFSKDPTEDDWERARLDLEEIKAEIEAGRDFAEIALERSEDIGSGQNGGDLGFFGTGQMVKPFEDAAFALEIGALSDLVRSKFGWHLIKVMEKKTEDDKEQIRASHILLKVDRASTETLDLLFQRAENFITDANENDFQSAAANLELKVENTGLFEKESLMKGIGTDRAMNKFALNNDVGTISHVYESDATITVVQVSEKAPEGIASLEEVRLQAEIGLKTEMGMMACETEIRKIDDEIKAGVDFKKASIDAGYDVTSTDLIPRNGFIRGIGRDPKVIGTIFSLKNPGDMTEPFKYARGWGIIKLVERQSPDLAEYTEVRDSLEQALTTSKQQEIFNNWYVDVISSAEIEDYLDEIFGAR